MSKRATALRITEGSTRAFNRDKMQARLTQWAELMIALTQFEDQVEQALKDDVIQFDVDGDMDQFWEHLTSARDILRDGVPVR